MVTYWPGPAPTSAAELARYVRAEFEKLANELRQPSLLQLKELHVEPEKPRDGMICFFDGTDVNPDASGNPGIYGRVGGAWVRLG